MNKEVEKSAFLSALRSLTDTLGDEIGTSDGQWTVKGFIDVYRNIYTISSDTKVVSKILEIHLFPRLLAFAEQLGFGLVLADHQNYYPDISFVKLSDPDLKFAVDLKTTYKLESRPDFCNGFTLGSHGAYFTNRNSTKNIQFPYKDYAGHFCLGIIYSRGAQQNIDETRRFHIDELQSIVSVVGDFRMFVQEKWRIASDKRGSGNTANIGSINRVDDIIAGNGMFSKLGEGWFDDYWMNFGKITDKNEAGETYTIRNLIDFVRYRRGDESKVVPKATRQRKERHD